MYVIWGFKDGDIGMSNGGIKDDAIEIAMSNGGIKDGDKCHMALGIQRWRHRYVIWGFKDGDIGLLYGD